MTVSSVDWKQFFLITFIGLIILTLAGCAAGPNSVVGTASKAGEIAGFWLGLWHGIICPITFITSLFSNHVSIYEVHNSGGWYNLGFLMGAGSVLGGGASSASSTRREM
jgi:polyferredoxin